uniref:RING-type domain-containing protein n=1 Tax=Alexandrium monilatum TaxID=311494 RepID=A0A7S4RRQ9_9DINO
MAASGGEPGLVLCWEAEGAGGEQPENPLQLSSFRQACTRARGAAGVRCRCRFNSPSCSSRALLLCLLLTIAEASAVFTLIAVLPFPARPRLAVFLAMLVLQCIVTGGMMDDVQDGATEVRCSWLIMACTFSMPAFACLLDLGVQVASEAPDRQEPYGFHVALGLLAYHSLLACAVFRAAWRRSGRPGGIPAKPAVLEARKYEEISAASRALCSSCAICLGDFGGGDMVLPLPCRHAFHAQCLGQWLRRSETCPLRCQAARLRLPRAGQSAARGALQGAPPQRSQAPASARASDGSAGADAEGEDRSDSPGDELNPALAV